MTGTSGSPGAARLSPAARRDQITAVATRMIDEGGVEALTMTDLATAAGVTRALVYRYFPGREDVITEVLRRQSVELLAATAPRAGATVGENLDRALTVYRDRFARTLERVQDGAGSSTFAAAIAGHARDVQVGRIAAQLVDPGQPGARERLHAWLMLVEDLAPSASPDYVTWCLGALQGLFGRNLDLDRTPAG